MVLRSLTEAEYQSVSSTCSEIIWLRGLLSDFGILSSCPTPLYGDNLSAIRHASNPVYHERTKHIELERHLIRDLPQNDVITLPHVASNIQLTGIFRKAMTIVSCILVHLVCSLLQLIRLTSNSTLLISSRQTVVSQSNSTPV